MKTERPPIIPLATVWDIANGTRQGRYLRTLERAAIRRAAFSLPRGVAADLGCGSGEWAGLLAGLGWLVSCLDVDLPTLKICGRNVPAAVLFNMDPRTTALPLLSDHYSLALCIEVAELMGQTWFPNEVARVLRTGGVFVGVHMNRWSWRGLLQRLRYRLRGDPNAAIYYRESWRAVRSRFTRAGFTVTQEVGYCWGPCGRESNSRWVPIWAWLERLLCLRFLPAISPWVLVTLRRAHS